MELLKRLAEKIQAMRAIEVRKVNLFAKNYIAQECKDILNDSSDIMVETSKILAEAQAKIQELEAKNKLLEKRCGEAETRINMMEDNNRMKLFATYITKEMKDLMPYMTTVTLRNKCGHIIKVSNSIAHLIDNGDVFAEEALNEEKIA